MLPLSSVQESGSSVFLRMLGPEKDGAIFL